MDRIECTVDASRILGADLTGIANRSDHEFRNRHPELAWSDEESRFVQFDARWFLEFLVTAIELDDPSLFGNYVRWTCRVCLARKISLKLLVEHAEVTTALLLAEVREPRKRRIRTMVEEALASLGAVTPDLTPVTFDETIRTVAGAYLRAMIAGDRRGALRVVEEAIHQGISVRDVLVRVLQPCMYEIGRRWEAYEIGVAAEHVATAITQYVMAVCYDRLLAKRAEPKGRLTVLGVSGDLHELGARMVSDICESEGWGLSYLGTNVPVDAVVSQLASSPSDGVGISITMGFNLNRAHRLIRAIRNHGTIGRTPIVVGGAAIRAQPDLFQKLEADAFAEDGDSAGRVFEKLVKDMKDAQ